MRYGNVELHNVADIIEDPGRAGFGISRLPLKILPGINKGAGNMAKMGTGCEIRGMLPEGGAAKVVLEVVDSNTTPPVVTVYHGCFCAQSIAVGKAPLELVIKEPAAMAAMLRISSERKLPFDPRLVRVRLPSIHTARIISVEGDLSYPGPEAVPEKKILFYGSSITHGACAIAPEGTYAAQCARRLGCDFINLGFGGSAQMDAPIADHIAGRNDWDMAVFEMGINVRTWPLDKFYGAAENFLKTVAAAHPDKYIFCIDMFTNDADFEANSQKGVGFREAMKEIVGKYRSGKIVHVDGRGILTDPTGLRTDLVHPNDEGMQEMGRNLADAIARKLK